MFAKCAQGQYPVDLRSRCPPRPNSTTLIRGAIAGFDHYARGLRYPRRRVQHQIIWPTPIYVDTFYPPTGALHLNAINVWRCTVWQRTQAPCRSSLSPGEDSSHLVALLQVMKGLEWLEVEGFVGDPLADWAKMDDQVVICRATVH